MITTTICPKCHPIDGFLSDRLDPVPAFISIHQVISFLWRCLNAGESDFVFFHLLNTVAFLFIADDFTGTHAWVTLIEGAKRWVLFPYGTDKATIGMQDPQIPSAIWFSSECYQKSMELNPGAIEILQYPEETVYVPAGWPHLVLNLEFSTAITHNYATEYPSFSRILHATEEEEPEMSVQWKEYLQRERPEIWAQHAKDTESNLVLVE